MAVKVGVLLSGRASCRMYKALGRITSTPKQSKAKQSVREWRKELCLLLCLDAMYSFFRLIKCVL